ncbi:hypothetical protein DFS34DRAFT_277371 [Phlyctochytrium arcticum]|nr:hypothetical protein DFS34DRAFT_277371 [Phlyctochytrium arcticum]
MPETTFRFLVNFLPDDGYNLKLDTHEHCLGTIKMKVLKHLRDASSGPLPSPKHLILRNHFTKKVITQEQLMSATIAEVCGTDRIFEVERDRTSTVLAACCTPPAQLLLIAVLSAGLLLLRWSIAGTWSEAFKLWARDMISAAISALIFFIVQRFFNNSDS